MRRAEALRDEIEQDIVTGRLQPGERLDEQSLADRFGVSRTPIREALMQLASTGMVELHSRRGAFVASLGLKEIIERFEAMAALEQARAMPHGPARSEALKRAGILQNTADMQGLLVAKRGRPRKN